MDLQKAIKNYGANKPSWVKVVIISIKTITGIVGGSLILQNEHPYIALTVLALGAVANEVSNLYDWESN